MANFTRSCIVSAALTAAVSLVLRDAIARLGAGCHDLPTRRAHRRPRQHRRRRRLRHRRRRPRQRLAVSVAHSQSVSDADAPRRRRRRPRRRPRPDATATGADSSAGSITDLAKQRFNQMITNRVLGTVLLGINEQVNCNDCVSAFGSAGSFSAGIHGRKNLTANLSLLAGIAYTHYSEGGYSVTSAPIGAFALRYDFADWGSSRPFFDIGAILTPYRKGALPPQLTRQASARCRWTARPPRENYGVYGRAGWISRLSPRDEVAASVEVWQLWQRVKGYTDPTRRVQSVRRHPSPPAPTRPTSSRSAASGRICSAAASRPTSMAASCSRSARNPASSPP